MKSAPGIVWDMRGNGGGLTQVGLDVASGFPARGGRVSYCNQRIFRSDPPAFDPTRYATCPRAGRALCVRGQVAVITEGLNYSAARTTFLAVKTKTKAVLVGAPTAGAFGAASTTQAFDGPPGFSVTIDAEPLLQRRRSAARAARSLRTSRSGTTRRTSPLAATPSSSAPSRRSSER